ncbi:hypothetical protein ACQKMV_15990 [Lysinibacillus sp. NPDC094403]|uniref:hypothetical protein n=1 Tax=Lysinibacillus sp. NPDC094403 TaxID=3390581 RepID=UPI003D08F5DB
MKGMNCAGTIQNPDALFICAKAKRQRQMFSVAKAKSQLQMFSARKQSVSGNYAKAKLIMKEVFI